MSEPETHPPLTREDVHPFWRHLTYANTDLVPAFPTAPLSYKDTEDLLSLRDTVARAILAHDTGMQGELCRDILEKSAQYWRPKLAESRAANYHNPFPPRDRLKLNRTFLNHFSPSHAAYHPLAGLMLLPVHAGIARSIVESAAHHMLQAGDIFGSASRQLFVGWRDWGKWEEHSPIHVYYRARAVEAAVEYEKAVEEAHFRRQLRDTVQGMSRTNSLSRSVYFPQQRLDSSAQHRRGQAEEVAWRWTGQ